MKFIIFGFDGLRPDRITGSSMPRLSAFLAAGVHCRNHRAVYPTETYVNHPTIFSGFLPERHGIIANAFFDPGISRTEYFVGSVVERVEQAERETRHGLFRVPTLTETAARNGLSVVTLSSNSPGSTRLISHRTGDVGGVNIPVNGIEHALPAQLRTELFGGKPSGERSKPDLAGLREINRLFRLLTARDGMPDLSVLWYGEPDHAYHAFGIDAPESLASLKTADSCFGEILDEYAGGDVQVVVASDHGHITVREHFDLTEALVRAGFKKGTNLADPDADFVLLWGYSGNIYVLNRELIPDICLALMEMPEVGMLFTRDRDSIRGVVEGTFSTRLVGGDSDRAGDIRFILRSDEDGSCVCAGPIGLGGGIHGGLHPAEISCLLGFGGSAFREKTTVDTVTGAIDITPTLYSLMGIKPGVVPQGRVLGEVLAKPVEIGAAGETDAIRRVFETGRGNFVQRLAIDYRGVVPYLSSGTRVR